MGLKSLIYWGKQRVFNKGCCAMTEGSNGRQVNQSWHLQWAIIVKVKSIICRAISTLTICEECYIANVPLQKSPYKLFNKGLTKALPLNDKNTIRKILQFTYNENEYYVRLLHADSARSMNTGFQTPTMPSIFSKTVPKLKQKNNALLGVKHQDSFLFELQFSHWTQIPSFISMEDTVLLN
jgi:hypothetical protein